MQKKDIDACLKKSVSTEPCYAQVVPPGDDSNAKSEKQSKSTPKQQEAQNQQL
jgi:hypothetical protein